MWSSITRLLDEIRICESNAATTSAIVMAYVCIDTMVFLSLPKGQKQQGRVEFIRWVDTYMQSHDDQPYKYRGIDVYGARCAVLHTYGVEADFHKRNPGVKRYIYHDGGLHIYDPVKNERLVIIGTASFLNDVIYAVLAFIEKCKSDIKLRQLVEKRLPELLISISFPSKYNSV